MKKSLNVKILNSSNLMKILVASIINQGYLYVLLRGLIEEPKQVYVRLLQAIKPNSD